MKMKVCLKAVLLIGGPEKGTRFRPLSLDIPKPLFPIAGLPLIEHHIQALRYLKDVLQEVFILGSYSPQILSQFIQEMNDKYGIRIRYLQEYEPMGTAGGLFHHRDRILSGEPDGIFVINGDICSNLPLRQIFQSHFKRSLSDTPSSEVDGNIPWITIMGTEATRQESVKYGCMVTVPSSEEDRASDVECPPRLVHYVEKPQSYISTLINCGIYLFSSDLFPFLKKIYKEKNEQMDNELRCSPSKVCEVPELSLEHDVLPVVAALGMAFVFKLDTHETGNWWCVVKTASSTIYANRMYLRSLSIQNDNTDGLISRLQLTSSNAAPVQASGDARLTGDVFIHPTAKVHPTASIGPNVSVQPHAEICGGARIRDSIILSEARVGSHSLILNSIVGMKASVGDWSRIEGTPNDPNPDKAFAKMENNSLFNEHGKLNPSITILGCNVVVPSELIVLNSILLPHKQIGKSVKNEIVL